VQPFGLAEIALQSGALGDVDRGREHRPSSTALVGNRSQREIDDRLATGRLTGYLKRPRATPESVIESIPDTVGVPFVFPEPKLPEGVSVEFRRGVATQLAGSVVRSSNGSIEVEHPTGGHRVAKRRFELSCPTSSVCLRAGRRERALDSLAEFPIGNRLGGDDVLGHPGGDRLARDPLVAPGRVRARPGVGGGSARVPEPGPRRSPRGDRRH